MTRWKVSASRFAGKVWSNDTTPDDKVQQLNREREAARAPPGTRPTGKSMARPVPGGGVGSGLSTPTREEPIPEQLAPLRRNLQADLASAPTCTRCKQTVDVRQKFCADCGFELHEARPEPKRSLPLRGDAQTFMPETARSQDAPSSGRPFLLVPILQVWQQRKNFHPSRSQ